MFPYLSEVAGHLNPEERELLETRLRLQSQEIMKKYYRVLTSFCQSLCDRDFPLKELVRYLRMLKAYDPVKDVPPEQQESVFEGHMQQLKNATSIDDLFDVIEEYCTFFNFDVLACMIDEYGTVSDKQRLQKYKEEFHEYAKRRIYECPSNFVKKDSDKFAKLHLKLDSKYDKFGLKVLQGFQAAICEILEVSSKSLVLCQLGKGCVELTFRMPIFLQQSICHLSNDQKKSLAAIGVIRLSSGSYHFSTRDHQVIILCNPAYCYPDTMSCKNVFQMI